MLLLEHMTQLWKVNTDFREQAKSSVGNVQPRFHLAPQTSPICNNSFVIRSATDTVCKTKKLKMAVNILEIYLLYENWEVSCGQIKRSFLFQADLNRSCMTSCKELECKIVSVYSPAFKNLVSLTSKSLVLTSLKILPLIWSYLEKQPLLHYFSNCRFTNKTPSSF